MTKNEFVEKNIKLIASACKKYHHMCGGYIEFDDFFNHCCLLFLTRKSFDPNINEKPSPFIYKVVMMESLTIVKRHQCQKRKIRQEDLASIDFILNDDNSNKRFKENNVGEIHDDFTEHIANEMISLINNRLSDKQKIQFEYMLEGYTTKDVSKITGQTTKEINNHRIMIKRKAKRIIQQYNGYVEKEIDIEMINLIKDRLNDKQKIQYEYMLKGYKPKYISKLTGQSAAEINNHRTMIKRKARYVMENYNRTE